MSIEELAELVGRMRQAQKEYFKDRTTEAMESAKRLEREVDNALQQISDKQGRLFQ